MDALSIIRELKLFREHSIFYRANLNVEKIAGSVIGELIAEFVVAVEENLEESQKVVEARARANNMQALWAGLDNFWTRVGKYPNQKDRERDFFGYLDKIKSIDDISIEDKLIDQMNIIIAQEYAAAGKVMKASDFAMAGRGINMGVGLTDSNPAVPKYGVIFSKYYKGDPDLANCLLLLQFGARILMLHQDNSRTYSAPMTKYDPENSWLRKAGETLAELINLRDMDLAAQEEDPTASPMFPMRGEIRERDCRLAFAALNAAFEGDTFEDKGHPVHYKGLKEIFASGGKRTPEEARVVSERMEGVREGLTSLFQKFCPETPQNGFALTY